MNHLHHLTDWLIHFHLLLFTSVSLLHLHLHCMYLSLGGHLSHDMIAVLKKRNKMCEQHPHICLLLLYDWFDNYNEDPGWLTVRSLFVSSFIHDNRNERQWAMVSHPSWRFQATVVVSTPEIVILIILGNYCVYTWNPSQAHSLSSTNQFSLLSDWLLQLNWFVCCIILIINKRQLNWIRFLLGCQRHFHSLFVLFNEKMNRRILQSLGLGLVFVFDYLYYPSRVIPCLTRFVVEVILIWTC